MRRNTVFETVVQCTVSLVGGAAGGWFSVSGFLNGVVESPGHGSGTFSRAAQPGFFWVTESFWIVISLLCLSGVVDLFRKAYRRTPLGKAQQHTALQKKLAGRAQKKEAQVREVEAGAGPVPPWVRFPGRMEDIPEAAALVYLTKDFLPFWEPLPPEARTAYLHRNPPPSEEWRKMMEEM